MQGSTARGFVIGGAFWAGMGLIVASFLVGGIITMLPANITVLGTSGSCGPAAVVVIVDIVRADVDPTCVNAAFTPLLWGGVIGSIVFISGVTTVAVSLLSGRRT